MVGVMRTGKEQETGGKNNVEIGERSARKVTIGRKWSRIGERCTTAGHRTAPRGC